MKLMLPPLPAIKNKREANWTTNYLKEWVLEKSTIPSGPIEVKVTTTNSLPFSAVSENQLQDLHKCTTAKGFWYKHPDTGMANRFDVTFYRNSPAYIIIKYPKSFYVITVGTFILEKKNSKRKSLTALRAESIAIISNNLSS